MSSGRRPRARTLWHQSFGRLLMEHAPPGMEVHSEIELPRHSRRVDFLLLRGRSPECFDDQARVLRRLWPLIDRACLCELASPARGFRRDGLLRLLRYGLDYHLLQREHQRRGRPTTIEHSSHLCLALIVPSVNQALIEEIEEIGASVESLSAGYARLRGTTYSTFVINTNEVSQAERDEYLMLFSHHRVGLSQALRWWRTWHSPEGPMYDSDIQEMEGYEEMLAKFLEALTPEQRLAGLPPEERLAGLPPEERLAGLPPEERLAGLLPEQRLAGLPPEQRLAGLTPEERILVMSDDVLAALSPAYVQSLPQHVQTAIRARLERGNGAC